MSGKVNMNVSDILIDSGADCGIVALGLGYKGLNEGERHGHGKKRGKRGRGEGKRGEREKEKGGESF